MDFDKSSRELDELRADLKKFRVEAPHDGVVYYGKATDGRFANIAEMGGKLRPQGTVASNEILMTIVRPGSLYFLGSIPEADLAYATTGSVATVVPSAFSKMKIEGKVQSIATIPGSDGNFPVLIELQVDAPKKVVAGMTGKAKWIAYFNPKAITIPNRLLHQEADNEDVSYVFALNAEAKPEKRTVERGIVSGDRIEIVSGISPEDKLVESDGSKK